MKWLKFWSWSAFDSFSWEAGAAVIAAAVAVIGAVVGFGVTSAQNRRERRAHIYAEAIGAVSDYLEGPYRVARCHNNDNERFAISTDMSAIQGRIDANLVLLRLHAPTYVANAYVAYVAAARQEAGQQMTAEWNKRPAKRHRDANMHQRFDRTASSAKKDVLLAAMERDIGRRWWKFWRWFRA